MAISCTVAPCKLAVPCIPSVSPRIYSLRTAQGLPWHSVRAHLHARDGWRDVLEPVVNGTRNVIGRKGSWLIRLERMHSIRAAVVPARYDNVELMQYMTFCLCLFNDGPSLWLLTPKLWEPNFLAGVHPIPVVREGRPFPNRIRSGNWTSEFRYGEIPWETSFVILPCEPGTD